MRPGGLSSGLADTRAAVDVRDGGAALSRDAFVVCMRQIPGAVAIIATSHDGQRHGLTATSWCSVSAEPPSILVCVNRDAGAHEAIRQAGQFSINPLTTDHEEVMSVFAGQRGLSGDSRFSHGNWQTGASDVPVLLDAVANLECRIVEQYVHHSHSLFIGHVTNLRVTPEAEALIYTKRATARAVTLA